MFMHDFLLFFQYHAFSYITSILNSERFSVEEQERLKEEAFTQLEVINRIFRRGSMILLCNFFFMFVLMKNTEIKGYL